MTKKYDRDFKLQTVRMTQEEGKQVAQVARELGISENTLYRWMSEFRQSPTRKQRVNFRSVFATWKRRTRS
jgi:transposase